MQIGFLVPRPHERLVIEHFQKQIDALRDDQRLRLAHLLRSWGWETAPDTFALVRRAIKNIKRNLP